MERHLLTAAELDDFAKEVPEWSVAGDALERTYRFADFVHAFTANV